MTDRLLDEIAPRYIREKRIDLTLDPAIVQVRAFNPVRVIVDYSRAAPEGVVLPLILEIQGPSAGSYQRREFLRVAPRALLWSPREGGVHLVVLREAAHNRWFGSLRLDVEGELLEPKRLT